MGRDLARGDVPTLILATLAGGAKHGYAIARAIEHESGEVLSLREGSLYPALRKLEHDGFVLSAWHEPARGPARKVYTLTDRGQAELAARTNDWYTYVTAVMAVLKNGGTDREQSPSGTLSRRRGRTPEAPALS